MADYSRLIARLEAAETPANVLRVFAMMEHGVTPVTRKFSRYYAQAVAAYSEDDKDRSLGYLLLAAMEMVPEGWFLILKGYAQMWDVTLHAGGAESAYRHVISKSHHPCTALGAACLRAMKAQSND